ncbi:type IV toxin-antitoxin system AbiEi family antitoxin domain-containing protein [Desulfobaculum sp. SPO524]|uniref:type IV toxin-antitoxin system AbiEi family antitoxin domain-containing protein n=1 Tax=Desulfobaculum sp. SPO524 TaxID=3378071 RepID=UPI0038549167
MTKADTKSSLHKAIQVFKERGGMLRTGEALKLGIHPAVLYRLRDTGQIEQLSRGLFRLASSPEMENPDLATVAAPVPKGVVCLISALSFHGITTQIPHEVHVAIPRDKTPPHVTFPPVSIHRFSGEAYTMGIEEHEIDGVTVKVYSPEKTLADCVKFRNSVGVDTVVEAFRMYKAGGKIRVSDILRFADVCRVRTRTETYLEALL